MRNSVLEVFIESYFYVGEFLCSLHGFNIFGAKAVFSMGACRLFPQYVLAITLLVGSEPGVAMTIACTG